MTSRNTILGAALVVLGVVGLAPGQAAARDMVLYVEQSGSTPALMRFVSDTLTGVRLVPMRGSRADREAMRLDEGAVAVRVTIVARAAGDGATLTVYSRAGWNVVEVPFRRGQPDRGASSSLRASIQEALQAQGPSPESQRASARRAQMDDDELTGGGRRRAAAPVRIAAAPVLGGGTSDALDGETEAAPAARTEQASASVGVAGTDDERPGVDLLAEANQPRDPGRPPIVSAEGGLDFGMRFASMDRPFDAMDTRMSSGLYLMPSARLVLRPFRGTGATLLRDLAFGGSYAGSVGLDARNQKTFRTVGMLHQRIEGFVEVDPALGGAGSAPRLIVGAGVTHESFEIYDDEPLVPGISYTGVTGRLGLSVQAFSPRLRLALVGHATLGLRALDAGTSTSVLWGGSATATFRILPFLSATAGYRASFATSSLEEGATMSDSYHAFHVGALAEL